MKALSIDIETLGSNVDSQILSIGACIFNLKTGKILHDFYFAISLEQNETIKATPGTIKFWIEQAKDNPEALRGLMSDEHPFITQKRVLLDLSMFIGKHEPETIWANGAKFDLGMLEYAYNKAAMDIPWTYNMDRDMRTLRHFAGDLKVDMFQDGIAHNALSDAKWQAKYISQAIFELGIL